MLEFLERRRSLFFLLILAILLRIAAAVFSEGFWHHDEHFQMLELLDRLRGQDFSESWEWGASIRNLLQVHLYRALVWPVEAFLDPFQQARFLRLVMAVTSVGVFLYWLKQLGDFHRFTLIFRQRIFLIWAVLGFLPFLNVRLSSENAGTLALMLFHGYFLRYLSDRQKSQAFFVGVLAAIAFYLRFQNAFAFLGLFIWALWLSPALLKKQGLWVFLGSIAVVLAITALDSWGYGHFALTPWNYFERNILQGVASQFGVSPFYGYFSSSLSSFFPLFLSSLLAFFFFIYKNPKSSLGALLLAFFVLHSFVPHKEIRFISAIFCFSPLFFASLDESLAQFSRTRFSLRTLFFLVSTSYLLILSFFPVRFEILFFEKIQKDLPEGARVYVLPKSNHPLALHEFELKFYQMNPLDVVFLKDSPLPSSGYLYGEGPYDRDKPHENCRLTHADPPKALRKFIDLVPGLSEGAKIYGRHLWHCQKRD